MRITGRRSQLVTKLKLHWQILIAIVLAVIAGRALGTETSVFGMPVLGIYDFVGTMFLNALRMLIVPTKS